MPFRKQKSKSRSLREVEMTIIQVGAKFGLSCADLAEPRFLRLAIQKRKLDEQISTLRLGLSPEKLHERRKPCPQYTDADLERIAASSGITQHDLCRRSIAGLVKGILDSIAYIALLGGQPLTEPTNIRTDEPKKEKPLCYPMKTKQQ